jgi:hypothetical protein
MSKNKSVKLKRPQTSFHTNATENNLNDDTELDPIKRQQIKNTKKA